MSQDVNQFQEQMEEKFRKDLENIQLDDQDSQLQSSTDFFQGLKSKLNSQINHIKNSNTKNLILEELKNNINKQLEAAQNFQDQIKEIKNINTANQSVIKQQKIQEIKNKIAKQNINASKIKLADEQIEEKQKQLSRVLFQQVQCQQIQEKNANAKYSKQSNKKNFQKKKQSTLNFDIQRKINLANLERQRINMQRQDQLSMKRQHRDLSQFFKQRFIKATIPKLEQTSILMNFSVSKPKSTFTNLQPLPNNQKNVLPKNSPQIALKSLKNNKRPKFLPVSQRQIKIQFKKIQKTSPNSNQNTQGLSQGSSRAQLNKTNDKSSQFSVLLQPYLKLIQKPLLNLHSSSSQYKPKFIKSYLNQKQKISAIDISDSNNKQKCVQQMVLNNQLEQEIDPLKLKQFKLIFENLTSLKGIQKFKNIQFGALQYNRIQQIKQLSSCTNLLELNLSNNLIKSIRLIQNLSQLRYLNLSNNKISQFKFTGGLLQILKLKQNQIEIINDLNANRYLRIVDLYQNRLHSIRKGFQMLYFLQELNLSKNYLNSLQGIQKLIMLQKADFSHNRLDKIYNNGNAFSFIFLNYLDLSNNQLQDIVHLFLPSLQKFYITNNKITGQKINKTLIYLPQLKQFNIDDNQIKGFAGIWFFIRYSQKLQIVKYDSNQYFLSVREKVRQLYEAIIYRNMTNLKILNHSPMDKGIKAYYESVYSSYLKKGLSINYTTGKLKKMEKLINFVLKQNAIILDLQQEMNKLRNQRFTQQKKFIQSKSTKRAELLEKVIEVLRQYLNDQSAEQQCFKIVENSKINSQKSFKNTQKKSLIKQSSIKSQLQKLQLKQPFLKNSNQTSQKQRSSSQNYNNLSSNNTILQIKDHIYYYHDRFQFQFLTKIHKIKSLFYIKKYKNQQIKKYFQKNKINLITLFNFIQKKIKENQIKKALAKFQRALKKNKQNQAAVLIQKVWRGYKYRKLYKKMISKIKGNLDDSFEMEEVDLDQFQAKEIPQFNFDLPDDVNFQQYIIEPKYFQLAAQQQKKRKSNKPMKLQSIQESNQQYKPMMNNFMKEQKIKQQKVKKKQEDQKLMKEWGFQNPATLQALRWKKKRKQQMKRKQAQMNMTAAQRYQRFKKLHK